MATKRQITLAIVEGLSDKTALEGILKKAFAPLNSETRVECVREDITSDKDVTPKNVVSRVTDVVKKYAARYGLQPKDFLRVIQLTDTDGAYIPDDAVTLPSGSIMVNPDPFYTPTAILTAHPDWIKERNQQKEKNRPVRKPSARVS